MDNKEDIEKEHINESVPLKTEYENIDNKKKIEELSLMQKLKIIKSNITIEPVIMCYIMPIILLLIATQNLNLEKACRVNLNYSAVICDALNERQTANYTEYEQNVQKLTAGIQAWKNALSISIPVLIILFVGAWSDKTGRRKACILIPIVGELLSCIGLIINTYYFLELPVQIAALTQSIFPAMTGGIFTNFIGIFSYIGDITTPEERTYRVGVVNIFLALGYLLGSALSAVLLRWTGYYGVFSISASLHIFNLVYVYFRIKDPNPKPVDEKNQGLFGFVKEFFDFNLVIETFKVAFKKGKSNKGCRVLLILIAVFVAYGPFQGELTILYLFTRYKFNWDEVKFSMWSTYSVISNIMGITFAISFFTNYLKLNDNTVGIIAIISKFVASFIYIFARNDLEFYLVPLLEFFNAGVLTALRSIATKLVSEEEYGKINSLFGLAEVTTPLVYGPLYSKVYVATINFLPGTAFVVGGLLTMPAIIIFWWLYIEHKKYNRNIQIENEELKITTVDSE